MGGARCPTAREPKSVSDGLCYSIHGVRFSLYGAQSSSRTQLHFRKSRLRQVSRTPSRADRECNPLMVFMEEAVSARQTLKGARHQTCRVDTLCFPGVVKARRMDGIQGEV